MKLVRSIACACLVLIASSGCAGPIEQWIVDTRVHQGDTALERGSLEEAQLAYRLALRVDPRNERARIGYSLVATQIADVQFKAGHLDDALATLSVAAKYDPQSVRMQGLRSQIEQARIKREIVVSNYPTYRETGAQISKSYAQLKLMNLKILDSLKKFDYSYNIVELNKAIQNSYELNLEVSRNTNRLVAFRQLVESGVPAVQGATGQPAAAPPSSLLPLP
ncbi:MAG: tetratricopeptide repeat protein [Candidatus Eremiobacteraeota bacterium]|nr:tetratricopeptide repeat protein [Candidatus Eremiobacteraeota bacterium]